MHNRQRGAPRFSGIERWNGIVEWNTGMCHPPPCKNIVLHVLWGFFAYLPASCNHLFTSCHSAYSKFMWTHKRSGLAVRGSPITTNRLLKFKVTQLDLLATPSYSNVKCILVHNPYGLFNLFIHV